MAIIEEDQHSALLAIAQSLLPGGTIDLPAFTQGQGAKYAKNAGIVRERLGTWTL